MFLNKILCLVFVLIFIDCINCTEKESESDEDDKLRQALVLVEILKKEYLKLLQSQYVMQQQLREMNTATTTDVVTPLNDVSNETISKHRAASIFRRMGLGEEIELTGLPNTRRANKVPIETVWDKKLMAYYRRARSQLENETTSNATSDTVDNTTEKTTTNITDGNKDDNQAITTIKSENTTTSETTVTNTTEKAITKQTVTKALKNKTPKKSIRKLKYPILKKKLRQDDKPDSKNEKMPDDKPDDKLQDDPEDNPEDKDQKKPDNKPEHKNKDKVEEKPGKKPEHKKKDKTDDFGEMLSDKNKDKVTKDPVMDQIASELDNEMKEGNVNKENENNEKTKNLGIKPTLKVHLARSTKLAMPLSENNAFCYLVPHTPLCVNRR